MFIQCSDCDYKYLVNSADLKPDGRMVQCANCNHRWFQEPLKGEEILASSVPKTSQKEEHDNANNKQSEEEVGKNCFSNFKLIKPFGDLIKSNKLFHI